MGVLCTESSFWKGDSGFFLLKARIMHFLNQAKSFRHMALHIYIYMQRETTALIKLKTFIFVYCVLVTF